MPEHCVWMREDEEDNVWEGSCSTDALFCFNFNSGGPAENKFVFCPYCGRKIVVPGDPHV